MKALWLTLSLLFAATLRADVATSPNYAVSAISIDAGGEKATSPNYASDNVINSVGGLVSSANYSGVVGFAGQINNAPVAQPDIATRMTNGTAQISLSYMLANDFDPDGDPLTLFDAQRTTPAGGSIGFFPTSLQYTPPPGYNGVDTFTYTIADSFNDTATSTITVVVAHLPAEQPQNTVLMFFLNDGQILLRVQAAPTYSSYTLQWTDNLNTGVWRDLATTGAGSEGMLLGIDNPGGAAERYYRAVFR